VPAEQDIDKSPGWSEGRQEARHQHVAVEHPDGRVTHAGLSASGPDVHP
jgi:hypothetical protein